MTSLFHLSGGSDPGLLALRIIETDPEFFALFAPGGQRGEIEDVQF